MSAAPSTPINQVCIVARNAARTARWYTDGLGMLPAGRAIFFGKRTERVQAVPNPLLLAAWALDRQGFFQVEVFQYRTPRSRPRRQDWTPADWGYSTVGVHVRDFDGALERLAALGSLPYTQPVGARGDRRVCAPDPDGKFDRWFERARVAGWTPHGKPLAVGIFRVMYVDDPDGFDVEMLQPRRWADRLTGFSPSMPYAVAEQHVFAAPEVVWARLSDLAGMESWSGLPVRVNRPEPFGVGTRRRLKMYERWVTEEIVGWDPAARVRVPPDLRRAARGPSRGGQRDGRREWLTRPLDGPVPLTRAADRPAHRHAAAAPHRTRPGRPGDGSAPGTRGRQETPMTEMAGGELFAGALQAEGIEFLLAGRRRSTCRSSS